MDESRADLLRRLREGGVSEAALPVELELRQGCCHTVRDMLAETGLPEEFAVRNYRSLGLPVPAFDEPVIDEGELEAWRMLKLLLDAGLPEEDLHELGRIAGRAAAQIVDAVVEVFVRAFARADESQAEFGLRLGELFGEVKPAIAPLTHTPVWMHLRERFRHELLRSVPGTKPVAIAFADIVDFTPLAERASVHELSRLAGQLERVAADAAVPPVRLIKLIGDAVMLAAPEPGPLVAAVCKLLEAGLPPLRVGIAAGEALNHGGDWYGTPVNLAARICGAAPPDAVLADGAVAAAVPGFTELGERELKGIAAPVRLYALQRSASHPSIDQLVPYGSGPEQPNMGT